MDKRDIHQFLIDYFQATECTFLEQADGALSVQLTPEADKELMNRPFYWHYAEKTGLKGKPLTLSLITDQSAAPESFKGELIHFGSPRLQQIFRSAKQHARFIRLHEQNRRSNQQQALHPWLLVNLKVSYEADRKKEVFHSYGLNLINGQIQKEFMQQLSQKSLAVKIPDFSFTIPPLIKPFSGVRRIQRFLTGQLQQEDHQWAEQAKKRWAEDLSLLNSFYEEQEEKPEAYFIEKAALQKQYEPKIRIDIINGGIIHLIPPIR
ncbi:YqhG family protein [Bacillus xiapuensis]|uniref:YqhG family protein n=1 Tax=Bacillus xiapuensis TaxID=2014075 RepID=UPI000C2341CF|nr:YqhG family protein [Bacillus xiapuensis]